VLENGAIFGIVPNTTKGECVGVDMDLDADADVRVGGCECGCGCGCKHYSATLTPVIKR
jgi:hypothetical protein